MTTLPLSPAYRGAVWAALGLQAALTLLLLLVLDGGATARVGACAMAGFWAGAAVVMVRRPMSPGPVDLWYVRWGYVPLLGAGVGMAAAMGRGGW